MIEHKVLDMIRGFAVLKDGKNLLAFLVWSVVYWVANALGVWRPRARVRACRCRSSAGSR